MNEDPNAQRKPSETLRKFFEEHEISVQAIPVAIVAHETVGMAWLGGTWLGCYKLQPSRLVASLANTSKVLEYMDQSKR